MVKQKHAIGRSEPLGRARVAIRRDNDAALGVDMGDCGDDFLNGAVADGLRIFFALNDNTRATLLGDNIDSLVSACRRNTSRPPRLSQQSGAIMFVLFRGHISVELRLADLVKYQHS